MPPFANSRSIANMRVRSHWLAWELPACPHLHGLCACCPIRFPFSILRLTITNEGSDAATSPDCSRKGHEMFRFPAEPRNDTDEGVFRVSCIISRLTRFKFYLPSPFLLAIVLVFVVLPLVWPESDDPASCPAALTVFNLEADVTSLTISAAAEHLAATCRDRPLWVWLQGREVNWGETLLPEHRPGGTRSLGLSPDGMTLAAGNVDGTVSLWDTATGKNASTWGER